MILFIVNPISGQGSKTRVVSRLRRQDCRIVYTEYAGHAEQLAREAEEDIVVAVGGDGTVNEVARGLIGTGKTLGIIPRGSGDGLALHLGLNQDLNRNIRIIENGKTHHLDAGTINGRYFFSVCGVGLDAIVSERFAKSGRRGLPSYIDQAIHSWKDHTAERYEIEIDGEKMVHEAVMVTVGNSDQWGHGAKVTLSPGICHILIILRALLFHSIPPGGCQMVALHVGKRLQCYAAKLHIHGNIGLVAQELQPSSTGKITLLEQIFCAQAALQHRRHTQRQQAQEALAVLLPQ